MGYNLQNLGTWSTLHNLTVWRMSLPSTSVDLNLFQVWMVSASFRQLSGLRVFLPTYVCCLIVFFAALLVGKVLSAFSAYTGREWPSESGKFQRLPKAIWVVCLPGKRTFLQDGMFQFLRKLLYSVEAENVYLSGKGVWASLRLWT